MAAPILCHVSRKLKICSNKYSIFGGQVKQWRRCLCVSSTIEERLDSKHDGSLAHHFKQAMEGHSVRPIFRTSEHDPRNHADHQEGLFYNISADHYQRWFKKAVVPTFDDMCKAFNENTLMIRKPALEVMNYMKLADYNQPVIRYLLYGRNGSGKTSTLTHVMHTSGMADWLILHVPWAASFIRYWKETQPSTHRAGRVDQPLDAAEWLSYFKQMNEPLLKTLDVRLKNKYVWSKREISEVGSPLLEAIDFGLNRVKYATDILGLVLKEIKQQAANGSFRVLVAVDGVNAFWSPITTIKMESDRCKKHEAGDLSIVQNFKKLLQNDWNNGAVVCTVDPFVNHTDNSSYLPKYLLSKQGFEAFDPHIPIHVPDYNEKEFHSCLEYYIDRKWIVNSHALTESGRKEILFLSCKNPYELYSVTRGI